jgi:hypothetical protein
LPFTIALPPTAAGSRRRILFFDKGLLSDQPVGDPAWRFTLHSPLKVGRTVIHAHHQTSARGA